MAEKMTIKNFKRKVFNSKFPSFRLIKYLRPMSIIACLLLLQGTQAIDISFTASNGGKSVGFWETCHIEDSSSFTESASTNFKEDICMTITRDISGSGDTYVYQEMFGSGGGNDYLIENELHMDNAVDLKDHVHSQLEPASSQVDRRVSCIDCDCAEANLLVIQDDKNGARAHTQIVDGTTNIKQTACISEDTTISQSSTGNGQDVLSLCEVWWGDLDRPHRGTVNWGWASGGSSSYKGCGTATANSLILNGESKVRANRIEHGVIAGNYYWGVVDKWWVLNPGSVITRSLGSIDESSDSNSNVLVDRSAAESAQKSTGIKWTYAEALSEDTTIFSDGLSSDPITTATAISKKNSARVELI